jgi:hypothetical protein
MPSRIDTERRPIQTGTVAVAAITVAAPLFMLTLGPVMACIAAAGGLLLVALVAWPLARLLCVVLGALLVFQSPSDAGKVAYVGLAVVCAGLSVVHLLRDPDPLVRCFRPMIFGGIVYAAVIGLSLVVATSSGATASAWFREALPYILLVLLPVVGIDAGSHLSSTQAHRIVGVLGVLTALGFALDWLNRRGVSSLGIGRVLLATGALPTLAFAYSIAHARGTLRAPMWLLTASVIMSLLLVTGARSNLVCLFAFVGVVGRKKNAGVNPARSAFYILAIVGALVVVVPLVGKYMIANPEFLDARVQAAKTVIQGTAAHDQSFEARQYRYLVDQETFHRHPWFGAGAVGTSDSPYILLARTGIIGAAAMLFYLGAIALSIRRTRRMSGPLPVHTAARAWALVLLVTTPFGPWFDDKGLALAVTLMVAAVVAQVAHAGPASSPVPPDEDEPSGVRLGHVAGRDGERRALVGVAREGNG